MLGPAVQTRLLELLPRWRARAGDQQPVRGLCRALQRGALLGTLTGSIAALIDASVTLVSGFHGDPVWYLSYSWALLVLWASGVGVAFAGWLELLRAGFERATATEGRRARRL